MDEKQIPIALPVPEACPICGASWRGGCQVPGKPFPKPGLRVFYSCGGKMHVKEDHSEQMHDGPYLSYVVVINGCSSQCPEYQAS